MRDLLQRIQRADWLVITLLLAGSAGISAKADTLYGVYSSAGSSGQGCGAGWTYDTWDGGGGGQSTNPSNVSISDCSNVFTGTSTAGLTSAFSQVTAMAQSGSGPVSGTAYSAVDLASASLHGSAGPGAFGGNMDAKLWDTLTFNTTGPVSIPFVFSVDGILTGFPPNCSTDADPSCQSRSAALQFGSGGVACFEGASPVPTVGCTHGSIANWAWSEGSFTGEFDNSGLVTWNVITNTPSHLVVDGLLTLSGVDPVVGLAADLSLSVSGTGAQDFTHTATIGFNLPSGVTFSSASGVFGTTSVPEPSLFVFCGLGVAGLALMRRRRA